MPLGIGTWSGGCQAQNSWHGGKGVSPVPPHPGPLPKGEGELSPAWRQIEASRHLARRPTEHPLLGKMAGVRRNGAAGLTLLPQTSLACVRPSLNS